MKEIEANLKACQKKVVKKKNKGGDLRSESAAIFGK
jgi:hypothetical protein